MVYVLLEYFEYSVCSIRVFEHGSGSASKLILTLLPLPETR